MIILLILISIIIYKFLFNLKNINDINLVNMFTTKNLINLYLNIIVSITINLVFFVYLYKISEVYDMKIFNILHLICVFFFFKFNNISSRIVFNKILLICLKKYPNVLNFNLKLHKINFQIFIIIRAVVRFIYFNYFLYNLYLYRIFDLKILYIIYLIIVFTEIIIYILDINWLFYEIFGDLLYCKNFSLTDRGDKKVIKFVTDKLVIYNDTKYSKEINSTSDISIILNEDFNTDESILKYEIWKVRKFYRKNA